MTDTTKKIFESFEIRKTHIQKTAFISWVTDIIEKSGWQVQVEKNGISGRNIVVGDVSKAKIIFTAHYDTCVAMPFPNFVTPRNISIYILYQILIGVMLLAPATILGYLASVNFEIGSTLVFDLVLLFEYFMMLLGPANKHTANDNTSGVTAVIDLIMNVPENQREEVAFVLFDLEELGMFGSSAFYSKHRKQVKNKLLINFDCISDGENILLAVRKKAKKFIPLLKEAFESNHTYSVEVLSKGVFYPSDQMQFPLGVGVAAMKRKGKIYYVDKIHTKKDTVYNYENIKFLVNGSLKLIEKIKEN